MKFCLFLFATSQGIIFDLFIQTFRYPRSETSLSWTCWRSVNLCFSLNILSEKLSKIQKAADLPSTIMTMMIIMSLLMEVITTITIMMHLILNVEQVVQGNILKCVWVLNGNTVLENARFIDFNLARLAKMCACFSQNLLRWQPQVSPVSKSFFL